MPSSVDVATWRRRFHEQREALEAARSARMEIVKKPSLERLRTTTQRGNALANHG
jgi:hypothetical protein